MVWRTTSTCSHVYTCPLSSPGEGLASKSSMQKNKSSLIYSTAFPLPRTRAGQSLFATCLESDSGAYLKARYITALHSLPLFHCTCLCKPNVDPSTTIPLLERSSFTVISNIETWSMKLIPKQSIQHISWH